jgi:cytoskeletal protein CcmA (bactofilin family)
LYIINMSSWRKYGGTNSFEKTSDIRVNSLVTNYFTILKQITNDIDISGNLIVSNRLNVYGDVSFNQDLTVEGNVFIHKDLDVSGNSHIHKNQYIDGNLTVLNYLYFQQEPTDIYMYGDPSGIAINKRHPEAELDICGNMQCILNVQSQLQETHNILCRNVDDQGIMLTVDEGYTSIGFYYDISMNINDLHKHADAIIQYETGGVLHIDASSHVQIVSNLIVTDNSDNIVNDAVLTVYNDLENDVFLYNVYDVSSAFTGSAICGLSKDNKSVINMNLLSKNSEIGGGIYGGAYPKDITRAMLSLGPTEFIKKKYEPAITIVEGKSNVKYKATTGINKPIPILDRYSLDVNGAMHLENTEITTTANIPFEIDSMQFSREYSNTGVVVGGPYQYSATVFNSQYSQESYVTKDGGSSWYPVNIALNQPNGSLVIMKTTWVYDASYILAYGANGTGYCLDISNNKWNKKQMNDNNGNPTANVIDIFACDFSGNKNSGNALAKVFFIMSDTAGTSFQLRWFNAAFGESTSYYQNNNYVLYDTNSLPIPDNINQYYRYTAGTIEGKCIDGAGYFRGIDYGYIYIAGNYSAGAGKANIRKYMFTNNGANSITDMLDCSHNISYNYNAISVVDMSNVFVVGNGIISHTVDGGQNWMDISKNTTELSIQDASLNSVYAYDASNAIAVGYRGAMVYTVDGYTWKNVPKQLLDLSGTGFPLVDASLNNAFIFDKNDFILSVNQSRFSATLNNIGSGKVIYNHTPGLLNSTNDSVLDLVGNMTIFGDIIIDKPTSNIKTTGSNLYIASDTSNIYIGAGTKAGNIYLGNENPDSTVYVTSKIDLGKNLRLNGGFEVTGGNVVIKASNYLVSYGVDVSYANIDVLTVDGGTQASRGALGQDLSYSFHVKGYRPAARIDASLSVNQLYADASSVFFGPVFSTYKGSDVSYSTDPAISVAGYSNFGPKIAIDGSNSLITLSSGKEANQNSFGGLYLSNGTGAFIDGNVYMGKCLVIKGGGTGYTLAVTDGTTSLKATEVNGTLNVTNTSNFSSKLHVSGNVDISGNTDISGNLIVRASSRFGNVDVSGNIDISGNSDISGNLIVRGIITGSVVPPSDYRIKTNVISLHDTSYNIDRIVPKYYYNTMANSEQFGFIAHEIQEEYPFLVSGVKDGPEIQGVNYTGLIGLLVKEIQDLKSRVAVLEQG